MLQTTPQSVSSLYPRQVNDAGLTFSAPLKRSLPINIVTTSNPRTCCITDHSQDTMSAINYFKTAGASGAGGSSSRIPKKNVGLNGPISQADTVAFHALLQQHPIFNQPIAAAGPLAGTALQAALKKAEITGAMKYGTGVFPLSTKLALTPGVNIATGTMGSIPCHTMRAYSLQQNAAKCPELEKERMFSFDKACKAKFAAIMEKH